MTTDQPSTYKAKYWAIAGIVISWATFWMFLFSPFGMICWIGILVYLLTKNFKPKWYLLLSAWLFVPGCSFVTGTINYAMGTATLQGAGGPEVFHGIDRDTRVESTSSGCIFVGYEPFVFPANNAAVRLCTTLFGFQRGAYNGVFPKEAEAQDMIKTGDTITVNHLNNFLYFNTSGKEVKVEASEFNYHHPYSNQFEKVVGKTVNNECFIFQKIDSSGIEEKKAIYLVEIGKSRVLATYIF